MSKISPAITIIIPAYNREVLIEETLRSITQQSYTNFECLIIDDGSLDRTVDVIKQFCSSDSRFELILRPGNRTKGAPECRNIGLEKAQGEYIQFFDSDDIMLPEMLLDKVTNLRNSTSAMFVVSKLGLLNEIGEVEHPEQRLICPGGFEGFLKNKISFYTPGPMFRRDYLLNQVMAFEPKLVRHQEWEYYTRLMAESPVYNVLDQYHCLYRLHTESIKAKSDKEGNLHYRRSKLLAIQLLNKNLKFREAKVIKKIFWPYGITTLKVALYNFHLLMIFLSIKWLISLRLSGIKSTRT